MMKNFAGGLGWHADSSDHCPDSSQIAMFHKPSGARLEIVKGRFADVLHASKIVAGLAGTANEQAVGLGKPLVTFPVPGHFGKNYVKMKMELFGDSAICATGPLDAAEAVARLLDNPARCRAMGAVGRLRMGQAGASMAIADSIMNTLGRICPKTSQS